MLSADTPCTMPLSSTVSVAPASLAEKGSVGLGGVSSLVTPQMAAAARARAARTATARAMMRGALEGAAVAWAEGRGRGEGFAWVEERECDEGSA